MYPNELYHHGILGQKWGVRRFQNPDGSLTPEGRRRLGYSEAPKRRLFGRKPAPKTGKNSPKQATVEAPAPPRPKSISEMSDAELKAYKDRLTLERDAYQLRSTISQLNPKAVNKGKAFMEGFVKENLVPMAKDALKDYLKKRVNEMLGVKDQNSLDKIKKEYERLELQKKIRDVKKDLNKEEDPNKELNDLATRMDAEKRIAQARQAILMYEEKKRAYQKTLRDEAEAERKAAAEIIEQFQRNYGYQPYLYLTDGT